MALGQSDISKLYVAIFGRASEGEGNEYWQNYSYNYTMADTANAMLNTEAAKYYFGDTVNSNEAFIEFIYKNTFGKTRDEDPEGIAYWVEKLNSGESRGSVVASIVQSATQPENAGDAQEQFLNRVEVSNYTANKIYSFTGDYTQFQKYTDAVSHNEYTKIATEKAIDYDSTIPKISELPSTQDDEVSSLNSEYKWNKEVITYSFNETIPYEYQYSSDSYSLTNNWHPFDSEDREITREIMDKIEEIANIELVEVAYGGDIRFNKVDMDYATNGFTMYPTSESDPIAGDVWINNIYDDIDSGGNSEQSYGYLTIVHEVGHALGLKHPFDSYPKLPSDQDNTNYTVMSYNDMNGVTLDFKIDDSGIMCEENINAMPDNYQLYDVNALIAIYGANNETNSGNDIYQLSTLYNDRSHYTIWDAGGIDTIDLSQTTHDSRIDMRDNSISSVDYHSVQEQEAETKEYFHSQNIYYADDWIHDSYNQCETDIYTGENNLSIAKGVIIENLLLGSGNDTVYDNISSNMIFTGGGDDSIILSGNGYDVVDGGDGNDTVYLNRSSSDISLEKDLNGDIFVFDIVNQTALAQLIGVESLNLIDETFALI